MKYPAIFGLTIIFFCMVVLVWHLVEKRDPSAGIVSMYLFLLALGTAFVLHERLGELTLGQYAKLIFYRDEAVKAANEIQEILDSVQAQRATVDVIAKHATEAKELAAAASESNKQANDQLEKLEAALETSEQTLATLESASLFQSTVLAAQNDDRRAFEDISAWAKDASFPFQQAAERARYEILKKYGGPMYTTWHVPWTEGVDPAKLSFDELIAAWNGANDDPRVRAGLASYIWGRSDIEKNKRLRFLIERYKQSASLVVTEAIGRVLAQEFNISVNPIAVDTFLANIPSQLPQ